MARHGALLSGAAPTSTFTALHTAAKPSTHRKVLVCQAELLHRLRRQQQGRSCSEQKLGCRRQNCGVAPRQRMLQPSG